MLQPVTLISGRRWSAGVRRLCFSRQTPVMTVRSGTQTTRGAVASRCGASALLTCPRLSAACEQPREAPPADTTGSSMDGPARRRSNLVRSERAVKRHERQKIMREEWGTAGKNTQDGREHRTHASFATRAAEPDIVSGRQMGCKTAAVAALHRQHKMVMVGAPTTELRPTQLQPAAS